MTAAFTITAGDNVAQPVTLSRGGVVVNLTGATITAALVARDGTQLIGWTAQSSSASGAVWGSGLVVVEFATSSSLARGGGLVLLVRVLLSSKTTTWRVPAVDVQAAPA